MTEDADSAGAFLSNTTVGRRELWIIRGTAAILLGLGAGLAPFASMPLAQIWPFIPIYESALAVSDLITAVLLFAQVPILRSRALLVLACGYLFSAFVQIPHMLSFPGVFSAAGILGAGSQTTAWLYIFWHAGLPLAVIAYSLLKTNDRRAETPLANPQRAIGLAAAGIAALVLVLTLATTWGHDFLPPVMEGNVKSVAMLAGFEATWALSIITLVVLGFRRPYSILDLWLMVVMCAWICDGALSSVFNAGRFDLGFYAGRIFGFVAANLVLIALLLGTSALYGRLGRSLKATAAARARLNDYAQSLEQRVEAAVHELRQYQEHLARAQRVGLLGSTQVDLQTQKVIWSAEVFRLFGLDPTTEPSFEAFLSVIAPEHLDHAHAISAKVRKGEEFEPYEFQIVLPDSSRRWLYRSTEVYRDANGEPTHMVSTFQDITDRKRAADELKETRSFLDLVIDHLPGTLVVKDAKDFRYRLWNRGSEELMGIPRDAVVGKTDYDLVPPEQAAQFAAGDRAAFAGRKQITIPEETVTTRHQGERIIQIKKVPVYDDKGDPSYLVSFAEDITERKKAEEARIRAEAATMAKSSFLANMSHEIRTPMNAVIGLSDLALRTDLNAKQQDYLVKIKSAAMALLGIINDILDFSKIEAGKMRLESDDFDPRAVLDGVANVSALRAAEKGVELLFSVDPELPAMVVGDSLRLGQVLQNLVSNAIKFTEQGEIVVSIDVVERDKGTIHLECSVADSGIGMDGEGLQRLFQPFSQADSSTTRRFGGTGLGLTISRQLVEMMGGTISAESAVGKGSLFRFDVRLGESAKAGPRSRLQVSAISKLRALVVDDSQASRSILEATLEHWGVTVDTVSSGDEGIAAVRRSGAARRSYDLMLIDWRMPGLDGIATARAIRSEATEAKPPAIILMTAYGRDDLMGKTDDVKIDAFLAKPISDSTLLDTISTALGAPAYMQGRPKRAKAIERTAPPGTRVLLVDDNDVNRQVGDETLTSAGFIVETADNGRAAVEKVLDPANHYDAVLMDVQMPVMDGLEATRMIRAKIGADRLPIIALTANAMVEERQRCLEAGMDDHAAKPIEPLVLIATLMRWIKPSEVRPIPPAGSAAGKPVAPPPAAKTANALDDLPVALPPFDITGALVRVNGKRPLLRRLILSFAEEFASAGPDLRRMISEGKAKDAERMAHTIKSTAATLGADSLSTVAAEIERHLRTGSTDGAGPLLESLEGRLTAALDAAATLRAIT